MTKSLEWAVHTHCPHFLRFNKPFLKSIYKNTMPEVFIYIISLNRHKKLWAGNYYLYFGGDKSKAERKWLLKGLARIWTQICVNLELVLRSAACHPCSKSSFTVKLLTFSLITWAGCSSSLTTAQMTFLFQPHWYPSCRLILSLSLCSSYSIHLASFSFLLSTLEDLGKKIFFLSQISFLHENSLYFNWAYLLLRAMSCFVPYLTAHSCH